MISDVCKSMRVHQTSLALDHQTRLFGETQGKLLVVADGLGGHEAGERASQLSIDGFIDYALNRLVWFMTAGCETDEDFGEQLKQALLSCQRRIEREVAAIPQRRGMGSTMTLAYIVWPKMFLVHVGDTRCYLLREGELQQLTRDHTIANLAAAIERDDSEFASATTEVQGDEPRPRSMANVLWNVIGGGNSDPHPDASAIELKMGDTLLLCSDGLTDHVGRRKLAEILSSDQTTAQMAQQLIDEANAAGGSDNVTVIVSRFTDDFETPPLEEEIELSIDTSVADTVDMEPAELLAQPIVPKIG